VDPWGSSQWVFPLLFSYICDHPEGCKVLDFPIVITTYESTVTISAIFLCPLDCRKDKLSDDGSLGLNIQ